MAAPIVLHIELDPSTGQISAKLPNDRLVAYGLLAFAQEMLISQGLAGVQRKPRSGIEVPHLVLPRDMRG